MEFLGKISDAPQQAILNRRVEWLVLAAVVGIFLLSRLPAILSGHQINVDESQVLAQVLRYRLDIVPWRSVDGTSSGPLNTWYLMAAQALGLPFGYVGAHLLAAASWAATLVAGFLFSRRVFGEAPALLATVLASIWLSCMQIDDFVYYSSEVLPVMLIAIGLYLGQGRFWSQMSGGFLLGMVPWAKLQLAPVAALVGLLAVAQILFSTTPQDGGSQSRGLSKRVSEVGLVVAAALIPSLIMLTLVWHGRVLQDFYQSYIVGNMEYAGQLDVPASLTKIHLPPGSSLLPA